MNQIKETLALVEGNVEEVEEHFNKILDKLGVYSADEMIKNYQKTVNQAHEGRLTNDQISYYMNNFGHISYTLGAGLARQGLSSDLVTIHHNLVEAKAYSGASSEDNRKLTREDKQAIATLETESEKIVEVLFTRVTQAVDQRMWSVNRILRTLETLASLNMSEAKLGRTQ